MSYQIKQEQPGEIQSGIGQSPPYARNDTASQLNEKTMLPAAIPPPQTQPYIQQPKPQFQQLPTSQGQSKGRYQNAIPLACLQQSPAPVDCPVCGVRALTQTEYVSGGTTHLTAALCCFVFCLGCVPYLASCFKDSEHKCRNCGVLLAVWHRSGRTEIMAHAQV